MLHRPQSRAAFPAGNLPAAAICRMRASLLIVLVSLLYFSTAVLAEDASSGIYPSILSTAPSQDSAVEAGGDTLPSGSLFLDRFQGAQSSFNQLLQRNLPYRVSYRIDEQNPELLTFKIRFTQGSYLYRDSLSLIHPPDVRVIMRPLPEGRSHEDAQGTHLILEHDFEVQVQIITSRGGQNLALSYQGCNERGICYPAMQTIAALPEVSSPGLSLLPDSSAAGGFLPESDSLAALLEQNLVMALIFSLALGALLNLTPCVIVMLPIFSAMISGHQSRSTAYALGVNSAYTLGLSLSYMALGLLLSLLGAGLQSYLQHPAALFIMAAILVACAVSAAGYFEFGPPSALLSGVQSQLDRQTQGTFTSAFLFGVLSSIMTTPCTSAPLAGVVLYIMQDGNLLRGSLSFFAIGLGMGLPLCIIGIFGVRYLDNLKWQGLLFKKIVAAMLLCLAYYMVREQLGAAQGIIFLILVFCVCSLIFYEIFTLMSQDRGSSLITTLSCAIIATGAVYSVWGIGTSAEDSPQDPDQVLFQSISSLDELRAYRGQEIYLIFTANWCTNCHVMTEGVYASPEFRQLAESRELKLLECDITNTRDPGIQDLLSHFQVIGVPAYVVLTRAGNVQSAGVGIRSLEDIRRRLSGSGS